MTNEEAIEELKRDIHNAKVTHHLSKHYEMAIKALEQEPCEDCISRAEAIEAVREAYSIYIPRMNGWEKGLPLKIDKAIYDLPSVQPKYPSDMGEVSDGYHTFNQLYHQRAVLFATIVKQNKDKAWKSYKHADGKFCFDSNGEWFIVGVDTPQGSYTYHYSKEYWDMFDCKELETSKEWDGHTEEDVIRLLTL